MKYKYLLMAAVMAVPTAMFTACGGDDEEPKKTDSEEPVIVALVNDTKALDYVDGSYTASQSEIQKAWVGDYEGWDENQKGNTKIRRLLTLNPNGTYTNVIQGKLLGSGKEDRWADFEHEAGTYTYNASSKTVNYTVRTDSVLKWDTQQMIGYKKKKYYDHEEGNYAEHVNFSSANNGQRSWITQDMYLQSLTDKSINIYFMMIVNVENR